MMQCVGLGRSQSPAGVRWQGGTTATPHVRPSLRGVRPGCSMAAPAAPAAPAAAAAAAQGSAVTGMQPHQAAAVLGVAHVQQQLARARARSAAVVASDAVPAHAARVKSMVLVLDAAGSAVLVLLLAGHRVDLRAVGEHLQLPRGCTRLATPGEAVAATGCALGCIPPLGHSTQLRMLVDTHLAALPPQQLVCAGAGQAGVQLVLPAAELLSAAVAAQVGGFSTTKLQQPPQDAEQQQQQQQQLTAQQLEQGLRAAAAQMPQPWAEGAEVVQLVGVIAQRRRVAKLLLFASLVPESVPALPTNGTAAYVRRLWRHPSTGLPCEVQLILGKTIERQRGRDATAALLDSIKVGCVVRLTGRLQPHPAARSSAGGTGSAGSSTAHQVLDVVVQDITRLHKSRDAMARAALKAQRAGHAHVITAVQVHGDAVSGSAAATAAQAATPGAGDDMPQQEPLLRQESAPTAAPAARQATAAATGRQRQAPVVGVQQQQQQLTTQQGPLQPQQQQQEQAYYACPLPRSSITVVDSLARIQRMHQLLLLLPAQQQGPGTRQVVGLDCEWQPYRKGEPRSPVALLQLATRKQVFLVDLLALCQEPAAAASSDAATSGSSSSSSRTAEQTALAAFMQQLLRAADVIKLGWQVQGDLKRLAQSYPQLCVPAAVGAVDATSGQGGTDSGHVSGWQGVQQLVELQELLGPVNPRKFQPSLSAVARRALGRPLDKRQQASDWGARPLTDAQVAYAANDAHVLLVLYDCLLSAGGARAM